MRTEGKIKGTMGVSKVRAVILDKIGVDSILLDPAVPEIFYFKHHVGASPIIILVGSPNANNI